MVIVGITALFAFNTEIEITHYKINSNKVSDTIRIALITDLHSCSYGEGQKELLDVIDKQQPNIVLLGGDIFDDVLPVNHTLDVLEHIAGRYPCFYVSGNHEYWSGNISAIKEVTVKYGITVLEGECKTVLIKDQQVNICGVDDAEAGENVMRTQIANADVEADSSLLTILLAHRPEYIKTYLKYDFDLVLSGHAHGGQWRIPGIVNGVYAPNQGWFPKYAGGMYRFDEKILIVSRGLARESTRIPRIFNRPEIVIVDVAAQNKSE